RAARALGPDAVTSLAHRESSRVGKSEVRMMTGRARDVVGARKNRVEEQQPAKLNPLVIDCRRHRIVGAQNHPWKLAHQPASALADSRSLRITNKVRLCRPESERHKTYDWHRYQHDKNAQPEPPRTRASL